MKICYVLSTSESTGGANRSFVDLVKKIDRNVFEVSVLLRRHGEIEQFLQSEQIPYAIIPFTNAVTTGNRLKDKIKQLIAPFMIRRIKAFLRQQDISLLHNNSVPALAGMQAAYEIGIPYICHIRENVICGLGTTFLDAKKHMRIVNGASKIIAISHYIANAYRLDPVKTEVIYDGINIEDYLYDKEIFSNRDVVLSIYGNLNKQKGQLIAVKAFELLEKQGYRNLKLRIIGNFETEYGKEVKEYIKSHCLDNIEIIPAVSQKNQLRMLRAQDDINLVCSDAEGLGRVTIESMLSGTLTIAAASGATLEIIDDRVNGILYEPNSPEALACALKNVLSNRAEMKEIAKQGQKNAFLQYNIDDYSKKIQHIYNRCLDSESAGRSYE